MQDILWNMHTALLSFALFVLFHRLLADLFDQFTHILRGSFTAIGVVTILSQCQWSYHDDVIKWKHFPRYWPFVRGIHRSPVNSPHKGQWRGALMFTLICVWINDWVNNREAGDLRRHRGFHDVTVMILKDVRLSTSTKPQQNTTKQQPCVYFC